MQSRIIRGSAHRIGDVIRRASYLVKWLGEIKLANDINCNYQLFSYVNSFRNLKADCIKRNGDKIWRQTMC